MYAEEHPYSRPRKGLRRQALAVSRLLQILWHYRVARSSRVTYNPYRLWIEPTAICNLRCPHCPNDRLAQQGHLGFMDFELFRKLIDESSPWVHDINVHHRGESLLHPRLFEMVEYAGKRGVYTKLHTNATLLDETKAHSIVGTPLDLISFSFDGFDAATYERRRPPARFQTTLENILRFLRLKAEGGTSHAHDRAGGA